MRKSFIAIVCITGALLLACPWAHGAVFNVSNLTDFQAALTLAGSNGVDDTINVAAGTYNVTTPLDYVENPPGGNLSILGAGAASTILDGGGAAQLMHLVPDVGAVLLDGVTIRNGADNQGAGLLGTIPPGSSLTISNSTISGNMASGDGGGFQVVGLGDFTLSNSTISGNSAGSVGGGGVIDADGVTITNSTITGNSAQNEAGLQIFATNLSVTNSTVTNNTIEPGNSSAGLIAFVNQTTTFTGNTVSGNTVAGPCAGTDTGVGLYIDTGGPITFTRNIVDSNTTPCPAWAVGASIYHAGTGTDTVTVADNIFSRNTSGPGTLTSPISIISDDGILNVANNTFTGNVSGQAGLSDVVLGVTNDGAELNVSNNIFSSDSLELDNNGDGVGLRSPATFRNNIIDPAKQLIGSGTTMSGNFNADPLFADVPGGDFHITAGSPAIDAGLGTAPGAQGFDVDGDLRPLAGGIDIGADEFRVPPTFDPVLDTLSLDEVQLTSNGNIRFDNAGTKAYAVVLNRLDQAGYVFELDMTSIKKTTPSSNPGATFNTKTGVLDIPVVDVGLAKTYNVQMQKRAGAFIFDLIKARKNK